MSARWVYAFVFLALASCTSQQAIATRATPVAPENATTIEPATVTPVGVTNKLGVHLLLDDGRNRWLASIWQGHMEYARTLVGEWGYVTELIRLDNLDPAAWQTFFDYCSKFHLTPILRLATTYDAIHKMWLAPSVDLDGSYTSVGRQYATFISSIRWPPRPHYIIVGNEPNHGDEWGFRPNPPAYARFLIDTSRAIHAVDPNAKVLNAALDDFAPNTNRQLLANGMAYIDAETFMDAMAAAEPDVFAAIDVWASHSYPLGPFTEGPWKQMFQIDLLNGASNSHHAEPPPGIFNRGVNGYAWELFKLASYRVTNLPVMITETGWQTTQTADSSLPGTVLPPSGLLAAPEYAVMALRGNNGQYPQYPTSGWRPWQDDPRVLGVTFFALDGFPREWQAMNWLVLDDSGRVLGTTPMFDLVRGNKLSP